MKCRKLLALLCALAMLLSVAMAENADETSSGGSASFATFATVPDTLTYKGGVVMRGFVKGADTSSHPLELAYVMTSSPYIVLNQPTHWDVTITGGEGDYLCEAILAYQEDLTQDEFTSEWTVPDCFRVEDGSFEYTFTAPGRYFWEFHVMDDNGQFFIFQTRIYETYEAADETVETTVVGKVNSIISELITPEMSDYTRALVLHDWLIYNANYDFTYTHYEAAGVLLYGTGVCDSYGRAYLMLCTAAGLECLYITGEAGAPEDPASWGSHGWNLVKLNGSWYHVDCTWDDPGEGGYERHDYFSLDDETMAVDHRWNHANDYEDGGMLVPEADGDVFWAAEDTVDEEQDYAFTFSTIEEFEQKFNALVASGSRLGATTGKYVGTDFNGMFTDFDQWCPAKAQALANEGLVTGAGCQIQGNYFTIMLVWTDPSDYIRIDAWSLTLTIGEEYLLSPTKFSPNEDVFAWTTSDPSVVSVVSGFNSNPADDIPDGPYALLTALTDGTATVTVSTLTDATDSLTVIVLPALAPDFDLELDEEKDGVELEWDAVPGVTEYQIIRVFEGTETVLASTTGIEYELSSIQLPGDVVQQVYIAGLRVVGGEVVARYVSESITYGKMKLDFTSTLPGALQSIDAEAFAGTASLTSFAVPEQVVSIGDRAFAGCTSLTTVHIPASVTSIGSGAFDGCPLKYAEVTQGSYADSWLQQYYPDVTLIY